MAANKTKATTNSVVAFLDKVPNATRRADAYALVKMMKGITRQRPKMWGPSIVGFGSYHYKYASGREGDWMLTAFSPRKTNITVYIMSGFDRYEELLAKLGKHACGKSCLYIKRLSDVHVPTLKTLVNESVKHLRRTHPSAASQ
jgi:hypothetical protein